MPCTSSARKKHFWIAMSLQDVISHAGACRVSAGNRLDGECGCGTLCARSETCVLACIPRATPVPCSHGRHSPSISRLGRLTKSSHHCSSYAESPCHTRRTSDMKNQKHQRWRSMKGKTGAENTAMATYCVQQGGVSTGSQARKSH